MLERLARSGEVERPDHLETMRGGQLVDARAMLAVSGLEPYQVGHTMSTFSNIGAGLLEGRDGDLRMLLPAPPRPPLDLISATVKSGR